MRQVLAAILMVMLMVLVGGGGAALGLATDGEAPKPRPKATFMYCGPRIDEQPGYWCVETRKSNYQGGVAAVTILTPTEYGLTGVRKPSR